MAVRPIDKGAVQRFYQRLLTRFGQTAMRHLRGRIPSKTLQRALRLIVTFTALRRRAILRIPHYWAIYRHDGRRGFGPTSRATFLVWFWDPKDDPRTQGGTKHPVRASDIVRLTAEQFKAGLEENARRKLRGGHPYMIVTKWAPGAFGSYFFENWAGMKGFRQKAEAIGEEEFRKFVRAQGLTRDHNASVKIKL